MEGIQVPNKETAQSPLSTQSHRDVARAGDFLADLPRAPEDPMFGLSAAYKDDQHPQKVNLGVGTYRDNDAKPWILPVVAKAEDIIRRDPSVDHEYLPIAGLQDYLLSSQRLVLGSLSSAIQDQRVASIQTISGTGALHLAALFLARFVKSSPANKVYLSSPAYVNHRPILQNAGLRVGSYPYYSAETRGLDFSGMLSKLRSIPNNSIILLHACAHNPTGVDPSRQQWKAIAEAMRAKGHIPFFDCAYQGLSLGNLDDDAWPMRYLIEQDFDMVMIAQSYAKNFGLYGERVGCLHVITRTSDLSARVRSQLVRLQRTTISTPPAYGARIVSLIFNDAQLFAQWIQNVQMMHNRITKMRKALKKHLDHIGAPGNWDHIVNQQGMFCYTGLNGDQVDTLRTNHHIYTTKDGRINIAGLNGSNVALVAKAFKEVLLRAKL